MLLWELLDSYCDDEEELWIDVFIFVWIILRLFHMGLRECKGVGFGLARILLGGVLFAFIMASLAVCTAE